MPSPLRRGVASSQVRDWHTATVPITIPSRAPRFSEYLWSPKLITTDLWLDGADASTIVTSSGRVTEWKDKSGNGRTAAQSDLALAPTVNEGRFNGLDTIYFSDTRLGWLEATWTVTGTGWHVFVVAALENLPNGGIGSFARLLTMRNSSAALGGDWNTTTGWAAINRNGTSANLRSEHNSAATTNQSVSYRDPNIIHSALLSGSQEFRLNGGTATTAAQGNSLNATAGVRIGGAWNGAVSQEFWDGPVGEVVIANGISSANRENIEGYLAHKWGLTSKLAAGHPYKTTPPIA